MAVKPIPEGYRTLTPYLYIRGAGEAIDFYTKAFDAKERVRMPGPGGTVGHAELDIGDSMIMLAEESPDMGVSSPQTLGGTGVSFMVYVEDVDAAFKKAVEAGAKATRPVEDKFYGDRMGSLRDPFGHEWTLGTHVEDVSPSEMERRSNEEIAKMEGQKG
jgi:PhnB protein